MKVLSKDQGPQYLNAVVYGETGTGKTSLGVTAPKPLILLSESQGNLHVKEAAKRLGVPVPERLLMEHMEDYRLVIRALRQDKSKPFRVLTNNGQLLHEQEEWPETVVIDSATDMCRIARAEIDMISPPQNGKDGLPFVSQRAWGVLQEKLHNVILGFRDCPVNVLFLCLADDRTEGEAETAVRTVKPSMAMKKLPGLLSAAVNIQGSAYRTQVLKKGAVRTVWGVLFSGPEHFALKSCAPLRPREVPNFTMWVNAVCGHVEPTEEPPSPSMEEVRAAPESEPAETTVNEEGEVVLPKQSEEPKGDKPTRRKKKTTAKKEKSDG